MKFFLGLAFGAMLTIGAFTLSGQNERAMHPRIAAAITALRDAEAYMRAAPHDFGGHKAAAMRACEQAREQLNLALAYRQGQDSPKR
jgi:hypothetical protein